ncbi:hypothetical protein AMI01nite_35250 [Aneurinibacillus migulanus]|nr:hypothetical protein AMI01nite_35250 [Aneurinibacillus migulanus]
MDKRMTKELVLEALNQAYRRRRPQNEVLHHLERGSQYASHEYQKRLTTYGMTGSIAVKATVMIIPASSPFIAY